MTELGSTDLAHSEGRPPFWRNTTLLKWLSQLGVLLFVAGFSWFGWSIASDSLSNRNLSPSFNFLEVGTSLRITEGIDQAPDTAGRAIWAGMVNTLRTAIAGIIAATILGVAIGLARLSKNWTARKAASGYVELIRNIPVLVQIIFWLVIIGGLPQLVGSAAEDELAALQTETATLLKAPNPEAPALTDDLSQRMEALAESQDPQNPGTALLKQAATATSEGDLARAAENLDRADVVGETGPIPGWLYISKRGFSVPRVFLADGFYQWLTLMIPFGFISWLLHRSLLKKRERDGGNTYALAFTLVSLTLFSFLAWTLSPITSFMGPVFDGAASLWGGIPQWLMQSAITLVAFGLAGRWIRNFLRSRHTPAGLAKITDDDYFWLIFAGVSAALTTLFVWKIWPGSASWIVNSGSDLFEVAADKFGNGRDRKILGFDRPDVVGERFQQYSPTGFTLTTFHGALFIGLVLYTASYIAEIVRGGILAVAHGQTEAALALGLTRAQMLRQVILPQAFRVIMPPLGNQYLNLTKNTTLGVAVSYPEVVQIGSSLYNANGQVLSVFTIWMAGFLACSIAIALIINKVSSRLKIVER